MKQSYALTLVMIFAALQSPGSTFVNQLNDLQDKPAVLSAAAPIYPEIIARVELKEIVYVRLTIDKMGLVSSAVALSGHPLLRPGAERAAKRWKFVPSESSSGPRNLLITFVFQIMPNGTDEEELTPVFTPPYQVEV